MEVYDLGLVIPYVPPPFIVTTTTEDMKEKFFKCLWVMKDTRIGLLIPEDFSQVTMEVVKVSDMGFQRPDTIPTVIAEVVEIGQV